MKEFLYVILSKFEIMNNSQGCNIIIGAFYDVQKTTTSLDKYTLSSKLKMLEFYILLFACCVILHAYSLVAFQNGCLQDVFFFQQYLQSVKQFLIRFGLGSNFLCRL